MAVCATARGAKQSGHTGWSASDGGRGRCAGGTSVTSRETDRENGYENRSPVFSYERSHIFNFISKHIVQMWQDVSVDIYGRSEITKHSLVQV